MTRKFTRLVLALMVLAGFAQSSLAQCPVGYNTAQVNWDHLDYYYNSGANVGPYGFPGGNYVSNANQNTEKFALGVNTVTIAMVSNIVPNGDNNINTAQTNSYGLGNNAQFTTTSAGASMTLTFATDVQNLKFSIYDLDSGQNMSIGAVNSAAVAQTVTLSLANVGSSIALTLNPGLAPLATPNATSNLINTDNKGTVNVDIAGPVHTVTITFSNKAGDFWLSDITACVSGTFPANYHKLASAKPFTNQPDYFLITPDNTSCYYADPVSGKCYELFRDNTQPFINSLAYDQVNHFLYYVTDGSPSPKTNKGIRKYNAATGAITTVVADITAAPLNIPTMDQGVESAGGAFYNGCYYFGIEGGKFSNAITRQTIIYRIDFDASFNAISAEQVYATPAYNNVGTSLHDWGDFMIENGTVFDFNTARQGGGPFTYPNSSIVHYDMQMDTVLKNYVNPVPANYWAGQVAMTWAGTMYSFWWNTNAPATGGIKPYDGAGGLGANVLLTVARGTAFPVNHGAGDASEPFKPAMDYGDAPATYDPAGLDPAVHEYDSLVYLGPTFGSTEFAEKVSANATGDNDDGMPSPPVFTHYQTGYDADIKVMNKSATNATVVAWLDVNNNGLYDPGEGITYTIAPGVAVQNQHLKWTGIGQVPIAVTNIFMRIRITSASNAMTVNTPNGYFNNGEVEDYMISVNDILPVKLNDFNAQAVANKSVNITWQTAGESNMKSFVIERSKDGANWEFVQAVDPKGNSAGNTDYTAVDNQPYSGTSWYRLISSAVDGRAVNSEVRKVTINKDIASIVITPNPFISKVSINLTLYKKQPVHIKLIDYSGVIIQQKTIAGEEGQNLIQLDRLYALAKGLYILEVSTDEEVRREKISRQ